MSSSPQSAGDSNRSSAGRGGGGRGGRGRRGGARGGRGGRGGSASRKGGRGGGRSGRGGRSDKGPPSQPPSAPSVQQQEDVEKLQREHEEAKAKRLEQERAEQLKKEQQERERQAKVKAELRQKQQQELEQQVKDAQLLLQSVVDTTRQHQETRALVEAEALAKFRKDFTTTQKKKLKTDLKKCQGFVKKIKSGAAYAANKPAETLVRDVETLNLSRYVEEVAAAILESKPKVTDLDVVVPLCTAMHLRYADFLPNLVPSLWSVVQLSGTTPDQAKQRRVYMRLLTEMVLTGLVTETKPLVKCLEKATGAKDGSFAVQDVLLVVAFCKAAGSGNAQVFGGKIPRSAQEARALLQEQVELYEQHQTSNDDKKMEAEVTATTPEASAEQPQDKTEEDDVPIVISPQSFQEAAECLAQVEGVLKDNGEGGGLDPNVCEILTNYCLGAYGTLATSLVQTHGKLQKLEKRCEQDRLLSGTLPDAREKGLADARKLRESLLKSVEALSDVLNQPMPHLAEDEDLAEEGGAGIEVWTKTGEEGEDFGPFDDEETRAFYCDIPDLLTTMPPALLGMSPEQIEARKAENAVKYGMDPAESQPLEEVGEALADEVAPKSEEQLDAEEVGDSALGTATDDNDKAAESGEAGETNKETPHYKLMVLLEQELPECNRREQLDELTEKFCTNHGSSKNARKRLQETLTHVPRSGLHLLPYYSRMAATVDRIWPDVAPTMVTELEQQFHGQAKYKKNQNIESRMRTAKYVGELTKFQVAPPIIALRCLRRCVEDFTGNNVDVACCLLESCGRYLDRMKHVHAKLATLMETMTRLSKAKHLDERLQALLKAAFYSVSPPPSGPRKQAKEYQPLEEYLRHLLLVKLEPTNASISYVTKQLIRFPWNDPSVQCGALVSRIMMKACRKGRYRTIQAIAGVAQSLRPQRAAGEATIRLIDSVLEEFHWSLEHPDFRDQQRTITYVRLLGELYCVSLVSTHVIFEQLYKFINTGHEIPPSLQEASEKMAAGDDAQEQQLPMLSSASGVSQTIQEDEEMEDAELEAVEKEPSPEQQQQPVAVSRFSKYDPRVPSPLDPPNSPFRIKLVCTLLEIVSKSIVSRNNLPRLMGFLAAFQRYLFTKVMLPSDVEFSLLDSFDIMDSHWRRIKRGDKAADSGFPRYLTWLEAHNATVAAEEVEAKLEVQKRARMENLTKNTGSVVDSLDAQSINDDDTTLSLIEDDGGTLDSDSAKDSVTEGNDEDMEFEVDEENGEDVYAPSEGDDEDEDEEATDSEEESDMEDEEEEFDEEAYMLQLEEEAFERELRRITMDALEKGKNTSRKQVADYMPSGSQIVKKKPTESAVTTDTSAPTMAFGDKTGMCFQLLKKGAKGKVEAKELVVPTDTNLAMVASKQDDAKAREKDEIKQRVLQYEAESADAEYAGGNVYLEQEKLQYIRNRPLSMDTIDKNFGTSGGNLRPAGDASKSSTSTRATGGPASGSGRGGGSSHGSFRGGRGRGRGSGRGRSSGGRSLYGA